VATMVPFHQKFGTMDTHMRSPRVWQQHAAS